MRLAILGGGAVVTELYLPACAYLDDIEIVAVVDPAAATAERIRDSAFKGAMIPAPYSGAWERLDRLPGGRPDAVVVALPNHLHEVATIDAVQRGYHVLVEKPLALTRAACQRISCAERSSGRLVAVGMVRRLHASVSALRSALAEGLIGRVLSIEVNDGAYYPWLSSSGAFFRSENGGVLADMGVHYLDLLTDLFGELEAQEYVDDWCGGVEANAVYMLRTSQGVPVSVQLSRDRTLKNGFRITGERGILTLEKDDFDACHWSLAKDGLGGRLRVARPFDNAKWPRDFLSGFAQQFIEFRDATHGKRHARCNVEEATKIVGLIEDAYNGRDPEQNTAFGHLGTDHDGPRIATGQVTVTGGTGFIGSRLVARLSAQRAGTIICPVRGYMRCVELARFGIEMPKVNLLEPDQAREVVKGSRYVFHLAYGRDGADAHEATVAGTKNIVEAAIAEGCESVVVLSTMYVFGQPHADVLVDESFPYCPIGGTYGTWKAEMEKWCIERARTTRNTRVVVLNPSCVWGVQGKTYTKMPSDLAKMGKFCWIEEGRGIANHTYVENLIDAMILAAGQPAAHGQNFIINDGTMRWREFLTPLLGPFADEQKSYSGSELRDLSRLRGTFSEVIRAMVAADPVRKAIAAHPVLSRLARTAAKRSRKVEELVVRAPRAISVAETAKAAPPEWLSDLFSPGQTRFSAAKAMATLGWRPRCDFSTGMAHTVNWLSQIGAFEAIK